MIKRLAALAALLVALPAWATVTGTPPPTSYSCTGNTSFTIPWSYLAASQVVATQTTGGVTTTVIGTVKPSIAPTSGTITLGTACPSGSTLTLSRVVPLTQPTSFRTGAYQGAPHEQAFDRLEMQIQQLATTAANATTTGLLTATDWVRFNQAVFTSLNQFQAVGTGAVPRSISSKLSETVSVKDFGAVGNGAAGTDDSTAFGLACTAATGRRLYVTAGTYRISQTMTCGAGVLWFESGAQLSIDAGKSFTASGRVISLGGDPTTGTGAIIYSNDANFFANDFGFSFSKTPSNGTDDFFHIRRDIAGSTGIIIRNDDITGSLTDSYIHLYGGPLTGVNQGANLRFSAGNLLNNGGLVNIVAQNDAAFSLINLASTPLDLYTAGVRQMQIASVPSAVNYWKFSGGLAASSISLTPAGTDTNISITNNTKGTGSHFFRTGATPAFQVEIKDTAGATNRLTLTGGTNPTISTSGGDLALASSTGRMSIPAVLFANLGTPANGEIAFCSDCLIANPCAGAGSGALARRLNGSWVCSDGSVAASSFADGSAVTPGINFTNETGTGLYRVGAGDLGLSILGVKLVDWTATSQSITIPGSITTQAQSVLEPSLANGNQIFTLLGKSTSSNASGSTVFTPNATAANSTYCLNVTGQASTLCVDGNNKTIIGSGGTGIGGSFRTAGTVTPGSILAGATATSSLTVTGGIAGADCVVTPPSGGTGLLALSCWVTTNTCNFSLGNSTAGTLTGPSGTWACRVFNP